MRRPLSGEEGIIFTVRFRRPHRGRPTKWRFFCNWLALAVALSAAAHEVIVKDAFTMLNIIPSMPGKEEVAARDAAEFAARTGNLYCLYSLTLHPLGRPAMKTVDAAVASYRKWAKLVEGSKVKPGILLQAIVGHWTQDLAAKESEPWQHAINVKGVMTRYCPLDPGYRAYIRETGRKLAACHPVVILGDDDIRAFSPEAECTCPLHTAEYNRRTGRTLTPEQLRELLVKADYRSPEHQAFAELQRDTVAGVCQLLREGIDAEDPSIPSCVCEPGWPWAQRYIPDYARAFAGPHHTACLRLANGQYFERTAKLDVGGLTLRTMAEYMRLAGENVLMLDEADTWPHNLWSKSSVAFHAKLVTAAFVGLKGAKLWLVNAHKGAYPVSRHYTEILERHRGLYGAVAAQIEGSRQTGVLIPCHSQFPAESLAHRKNLSTYDGDGWVQEYFSWYGVPFAPTFNLLLRNEVYALAGAKAVARFTDDELRQLLACRVLVDGTAAQALITRGLGDLLGVTLRTDAPLFTGDYSEMNADFLQYPKSARPPLFVPAEGAKTLSSFIWRESSFAKEFERVAASAVCYHNKLGGTVVTTAFKVGLAHAYAYGPARQQYLYDLLDAVAGRPMDNCCANAQNVMVLTRRTAEGADLVLVENLNLDAEHDVKLRRAQPPTQVEEMDAHGQWRPVNFSYADGLVTIPGEWACYATRLFRMR